MNNFQSVNKFSLYYRIIPRLALIFFIAVVTTLAISTGFVYFKLPQFLAVALPLDFMFFIILGVITFVAAYLEYSNLRYLIEEDALFLKEGVLRVDTETIPFQKIRNASFLQGITQRIFKVGDLVIDQDPESYTWEGIDTTTARIILDAVADKSNIQPITVAANQPFPLQHHLVSDSTPNEDKETPEA